jgi:hypothetical protein
MPPKEALYLRNALDHGESEAWSKVPFDSFFPDPSNAKFATLGLSPPSALGLTE